ncbi:MAG: hypothetical protein KGN35_09510, partial [Betaproteobacteria bacterium]|nr:hypothetical protein [Betaproteobacteria bacterium]
DMPRLLRSVRLSLHPVRQINQRFLKAEFNYTHSSVNLPIAMNPGIALEILGDHFAAADIFDDQIPASFLADFEMTLID